jgi:hypothetical protein
MPSREGAGAPSRGSSGDFVGGDTVAASLISRRISRAASLAPATCHGGGFARQARARRAPDAHATNAPGGVAQE